MARFSMARVAVVEHLAGGRHTLRHKGCPGCARTASALPAHLMAAARLGRKLAAGTADAAFERQLPRCASRPSSRSAAGSMAASRSMRLRGRVQSHLHHALHLEVVVVAGRQLARGRIWFGSRQPVRPSRNGLEGRRISCRFVGEVGDAGRVARPCLVVGQFEATKGLNRLDADQLLCQRTPPHSKGQVKKRSGTASQRGLDRRCSKGIRRIARPRQVQ